MRWFNFGIMSLAALVLQVGVGRLLSLGPQQIMPDLLLMLAVVIAFRGSSEDAPMACWILGLLKDLSSEAVLGSYALGFGLAAVVILRLRELLYGEHPLGLITMFFFASIAVEQLAWIIGVLRGDFSWEHYGSVGTTIVFAALLTAAVAPYGQWLLVKLHRQLGLSARRKYTR